MTILLCLLSVLLVQQPGQAEFGTISDRPREATGAPAVVLTKMRPADTPSGVNVSDRDPHGNGRRQRISHRSSGGGMPRQRFGPAGSERTVPRRQERNRRSVPGSRPQLRNHGSPDSAERKV